MIYTLTDNWLIAPDPDNAGRAQRWFEQIPAQAEPAPVPGIIQQVYPAYHGVAWYWRCFTMDRVPTEAERLLIEFGAVDYLAEVYVNGNHAGTFEGGETPCSFDITDLTHHGGENLLAVRVLNPTDRAIDGYVLDEVPHLNKVMNYTAGSSFNMGGIMYPVELHIVPSVRIVDVSAHPNCATGVIDVTVNVRNDTTTAADIRLTVLAGDASGLESVHGNEDATYQAQTGESAIEFTLSVAQPRLWALDDPFLYRVSVALDLDNRRVHQRSIRCGFRDFRIIDGWFYLNGKRLFLKSTHTGNHVPIGQKVPIVHDLVRRDMIYAKSSGFNAVRFMGVAWPEQLDFCDEIGLLVIESTYAAWQLGRSHLPESRQMPQSADIDERYDRSITRMILRDRNHPSIVAWELLNETHNSPVFDRAVAFLPKARALDATRLVMLNSGRFDNRFNIGSCSNPGSSTWEHLWGTEAPDAPELGPDLKYPSRDGAGDFHIYPHVPNSKEACGYIRALGHGTKPVFLSEYGIGSLFNVISEWRNYEAYGANPDLVDAALARDQSEKLTADWERLGFQNVYPFAEDLLKESQRLSARQRTLGFNVIRSNPQICGFNLTGMLDHASTGEGLWKFWRGWKPEMFDAVRDGWSPLRWCLFADPMHGYTGRDITLEAVLATEDILKPGDYPALFRVFGPDGLVWDRRTVVTIPESIPFAVHVLRETVRLEGPSGKYQFCAELEQGGDATGGSLTFYVTNPAELPRLSGRCETWGLDQSATVWLAAHGLHCAEFNAASPAGESLVLVGMPSDSDDTSRWDNLRCRMDQNGAAIVFLDANLFRNNPNAIDWLPIAQKGQCIEVWDWLYHKECVANRHPVFEDLQGPGVMDMEYYGDVTGHNVFIDQSTPDETICAAFNTGYHAVPGGYRASLLLAAYRSGNGRFVLNSLHLIDQLDKHPAASRLLLNLIRYVGSAKEHNR